MIGRISKTLIQGLQQVNSKLKLTTLGLGADIITLNLSKKLPRLTECTSQSELNQFKKLTLKNLFEGKGFFQILKEDFSGRGKGGPRAFISYLSIKGKKFNSKTPLEVIQLLKSSEGEVIGGSIFKKAPKDIKDINIFDIMGWESALGLSDDLEKAVKPGYVELLVVDSLHRDARGKNVKRLYDGLLQQAKANGNDLILARIENEGLLKIVKRYGWEVVKDAPIPIAYLKLNP